MIKEHECIVGKWLDAYVFSWPACTKNLELILILVLGYEVKVDFLNYF